MAAPLLVVSPHLDDAVFSCGRTLAAHPGSTVLTVFAGVPPEPSTHTTEWDRRCGFADAAAALARRHDEDERALGLVDARGLRLPFVDAQYGVVLDDAALREALRAAAARREDQPVVFPLGLFHADHERVHRACLAAFDGLAATRFVYEDAIYRAMPGQLERRWQALAAAGFRATPVAMPAGPAAIKASAVAAYGSQLASFTAEALADLERPERFWRLDRSA